MIDNILLVAASKNPDEIQCRLDIANWCEHANSVELKAVADLIRAQCELSALPAHDNSVRAAKLRIKVSALEPYCIKYWAAHIPSYLRHFKLRGGLPEKVDLNADDFIRFGRDLLAKYPIRHMDILGGLSCTKHFFSSDLLLSIHSLSLADCHLTDADALNMASSRKLKNIRWLFLGGNPISQMGVEELLKSKLLLNIKYIGFTGNTFDPNEQYSYDNGFVVDAGLPEDGQLLEAKLGRTAWLRQNARTFNDSVPDRYIL